MELANEREALLAKEKD